MAAPPTIRRYELFIDGKDVAGKEYIPIADPSTGEVWAEAAVAGPEEVKLAVDAAERAYELGEWRNKSARERARVLSKAASIMGESENLKELAQLDCRCTGRAVRELNAQTGRLPEWLEYFGHIAEGLEGQVTPFSGAYLNYVRRVPLGVVAQFTAFNHPLLLAVKKVAPALAAGNCIVLKPSEVTPCTAFELAKILTQAGLPDGVLNIVNGYGPVTGKAMLEEVRFSKFDLTGGPTAGRIIAEAAGRQLARCTTELGGNAPIVVFDDAKVEDCANGIAFGAFIASGQTCIAAKRIICQKGIAPQILEGLVDQCKYIATGMNSPSDPKTTMGCLISEKSAIAVEEAVQKAVAAGAKIAVGGKRNGAYYEPTILTDVTSAMECFQEEIFGPVITFMTFEEEAEALGLANDSKYGLGAAIWTRDIKRGHRMAHRIRCGIVWLNDHHRNDPSSPWGGLTSASGVGRENGWEALREYTQTQSVVASIEDAATPFSWFGGQEKRYN